MSDVAAILRSVGIDAPVRGERDLSGGCIHRVTAIELEGRAGVVVKRGAPSAHGLFEEERFGLERIAATGTVLVPRPLGVARTPSASALVMTRVEPAVADDASWARLGADLARLHASDAGSSRYGFEIDNHLGTTPQPNGWMDDWVDFNATRRLGHQLDLARSAGRLTAAEGDRVRRVIDRLGDLLPRDPKPALLHGDLWSGNAVPTTAGRVALIDPAPSIGDGWADIAMMQLFGGFPGPCHAAYASAARDHTRLPERLGVYQLYHVLNHVNIFGGRTYVAQAMEIASRLT